MKQDTAGSRSGRTGGIKKYLAHLAAPAILRILFSLVQKSSNIGPLFEADSSRSKHHPNPVGKPLTDKAHVPDILHQFCKEIKVGSREFFSFAKQLC